MSSSRREQVVPLPVEWDDALWDLTWERRLDLMERQALGWSVIRGVLPDDNAWYAAVGRELAMRWRRTLRNRAMLWGAWSAFWVLMIVAVRPEPWGMPASMVGLGLAVVAVFLVVRSRMARVVREADRRTREADERDGDDEGPVEYVRAA